VATIEQLFTEAYRLRLLSGLDDLMGLGGYRHVAGVDEAGRGCLAGPVVAAAAIVDASRPIPGVDDSKLVPADRRERVAERIKERALAWSVVAVWPPVIDRINILQATKRAMSGALAQLRPRPDCAVVDAVQLPGDAFPCLSLVRADILCYSVACASILAKVERDRLMTELDETYPQYGFARHKGYAAPEHLEALAAYGPSPLHRLTFRSVLPRESERVH
jgi:ribonuclease HII